MTRRHPPATRRGDRRRPTWLLLVLTAGLLVLLVVGVGLSRSPGPPDRAAAGVATGALDGPGTAGATSPRRTPVPAAAPLAAAAPTRLRIPAIGVDSTLMDLGLEDDGTLETPPGAYPAGWYTGGPTPGEMGPAIIAGHVRYVTPGVFARLADLSPGDVITVERIDGRDATFRVDELARFDKDAFPTQRVYGDLDHPGLRLITCDGLDAKTGEFEDNVVVFADLVQP